MELIIINNCMYGIFTAVALLLYWLNFFDNERKRQKSDSVFETGAKYIKGNWVKFLTNCVLVITTNIIWAEYIHGKHEPSFVYAELFTLAWAGGSITRAALKAIEEIFYQLIGRLKKWGRR